MFKKLIFVPFAAIASDSLEQLPFTERMTTSASKEVLLSAEDRQETELVTAGESTAESTPLAPVEQATFPKEEAAVVSEEATAPEATTQEAPVATAEATPALSESPAEEAAAVSEEATAPEATQEAPADAEAAAEATPALSESPAEEAAAVSEETTAPEATTEEKSTPVVHIQCRQFNIDNVNYLEIPINGENNQCGFYCLNTNRNDGISKLKEYKEAHPVVAELISTEIFRRLLLSEFFFLIEEDDKTKPAVEKLHNIQENITDENREESEATIAFTENQIKKAAYIYIDRYLDIFQNVPLMLSVERNLGENNVSLFDLVAAAHGYALEVYIQETALEDGSIDPAQLTLYHSFNPAQSGLEGDFKNLKLILTNFDRNPIDAQRSKTEWRNHFNRLDALDIEK